MTSPVPIALVVCDNVYREPSGKIALVGLFNRLFAAKLPARHPRLCVYASLTEIRPRTKLQLRIVHPETDAVVASIDGESSPNSDPMAVEDTVFFLSNLLFPQAGRYDIQLWGGGNLLSQRPFIVSRTRREENRR